VEDIRFHVPAIPIAQPRPRAFAVGPFRSRIVSAPSGHPVHDFKATCRMAAVEAYAGQPLAGPLALSLIFVLPRPSAKRWKRQAMPRLPHTGRPDTDNLIKSVKDSLNKVIWNDDSQIFELRAVKVIAAGDEQPHVEVVIWQGPEL
jgi:Holliday junction resolvase RusA-like endonuclease